MSTFGRVALGLSIIAVGAGALAVVGQSASGVGRTDETTMSTGDRTARTLRRETVTQAANVAIPNVPGKRLVSRVIDYPPGVGSVPHRHADSAFIYAYVLSGSIRSQVDGQTARVYRRGETWFENPGAHHPVSENASDTDPARLLAVIVVDATDEPLTIPDTH